MIHQSVDASAMTSSMFSFNEHMNVLKSKYPLFRNAEHDQLNDGFNLQTENGNSFSSMSWVSWRLKWKVVIEANNSKYIYSTWLNVTCYQEWQQGNTQSRFRSFNVEFTLFRSMLKLEDVKRQAISKCLHKVLRLLIVLAVLGRC